MKRIISVVTALFLLIVSAGCDIFSEKNESTETTQEETTCEPLEGWHYDHLDFTSLEELVESQKTIRTCIHSETMI